MYAEQDFVTFSGNEDAAAAVLGAGVSAADANPGSSAAASASAAAAAAADAGPRTVVIVGPSGSGKTHLLHAGKARAGSDGMLCSVPDMAVRLTLDLDESFFEKLCTAPALFVDGLEGAADDEAVAKLIELMVAERARLGLSTVFASRVCPKEIGAPNVTAALEGYRVVGIAPLDEAGRRTFAARAQERWHGENSPSLGDDAISYLTAQEGKLTDLDNAVHFLMQAPEGAAGRTLSADDVRAMLEA